MDAVNSALVGEQVGISFHPVFTVEEEATKRSWITKVEKALTPSSDPCCFTDITKLKEGSGQCVQHRVKCDLPRALDGFVCGFSCKDFSKANMQRGVRRGHDISRALTSPGKSADTMHGFLDVLDSCNPDFFWLRKWTSCWVRRTARRLTTCLPRHRRADTMCRHMW